MGAGAPDHAFEHLGGDDHGSEGAVAGVDDAALEDGHFGCANFDAEVAAGDHCAIGGVDDFGEGLEGDGGFDFGDEGNVASGGGEGFAPGVDIVDGADEGESDVVHAVFDGEAGVGAVGFGDGFELRACAEGVEAGAWGEQAAAAHLGFDAGSADGFDEDIDFAVAEVDAVAGPDFVGERGVGATDDYAVGFAAQRLVGAGDDGECVAAGDFKGLVGIGDADFGALEIAEDGDGFAGRALGVADGDGELGPGLGDRRGRS